MRRILYPVACLALCVSFAASAQAAAASPDSRVMREGLRSLLRSDDAPASLKRTARRALAGKFKRVSAKRGRRALRLVRREGRNRSKAKARAAALYIGPVGCFYPYRVNGPYDWHRVCIASADSDPGPGERQAWILDYEIFDWGHACWRGEGYATLYTPSTNERFTFLYPWTFCTNLWSTWPNWPS